MDTVISSLSIIENRDYVEILNEIYSIGYDILSFKLESEKALKGSVPIKELSTLMNNIPNIITYCACSEILAKSQYTGKPFKEAEQLREYCRFGQTQKGSYIITVMIPLDETYREKTLFQFDEDYKADEEDEEYLKDLGRKTIVRLINGLNEVKEIDLIDETKFKDEYPLTLNKNICEAFTDISKTMQDYTINITSKWESITRKSEYVLPTNANIVPREVLSKFEKMAEYLKTIPEEKRIELQGEIKSMHTYGACEKDILIVVYSKSIRRRVHVIIENEDDKKTILEAFGKKIEIKATGILGKPPDSSHWYLSNYSHLATFVQTTINDHP
jgi:predicted HTH domain antitoxin